MRIILGSIRDSSWILRYDRIGIGAGGTGATSYGTPYCVADATCNGKLYHKTNAEKSTASIEFNDNGDGGPGRRGEAGRRVFLY